MKMKQKEFRALKQVKLNGFPAISFELQSILDLLRKPDIERFLSLLSVFAISGIYDGDGVP
jgi:hypothetical protein